MARISAVERRRELVAAAVRVICRDGVNAATTRAIVAEANMALASFHYAFTSRDELIAEVIKVVVEQANEAAHDSIADGATLEETLRNGLLNFLRHLEVDAPYEQAQFELSQYALRTPGLAGMAQRQYDSYYRLAAELLKLAASRTGTQWIVPLEDVARHLVTLTDGITTTWLIDHDSAAAARTIEVAAGSIAGLAIAATTSGVSRDATAGRP